MPGRDAHYRLEVDFMDAINGATKRVTLPDGASVDVAIPPGTHDGQVLRLRGKGEPGTGGGTPGDALVEVAVRPHPVFERDGDDIRVELPISLREAVLGGKVEVPTPSGAVMMTLPKGGNTGRVLRLKRKGVRRPDGGRGDMYVKLRVVLPENDGELEQFATGWAAGKTKNPRHGMGA
jgi:DnaJ-class molecular chaperone